MPDDAVLYSADWWAYDAVDGEDAAVEVDRTDQNEVSVMVRGRSGTDDQGTLYLTVRNARRLAQALLDAAAAKTPEATASASLTTQKGEEAS